jgi:hypothetical protein
MQSDILKLVVVKHVKIQFRDVKTHAKTFYLYVILTIHKCIEIAI